MAKKKTSKKMGRPILIDDDKDRQLRGILRLKPTLKDCAAFLEVHPDTVEKHIRKKYKMTFSEFRTENMVHTRFSLIRTAIKQAENGNTAMLIFCLKNLCGWADNPSNDKEFEKKLEIIITKLDKKKPRKVINENER